MTQVWVVQYDEGLYLFKDADTAEQSIKDMYKGEACEFERQLITDIAFKLVVTKNDRVQDAIGVVQFDVHDSPTVIHRYVTEIVPEKRREEF